MRGLRSRRPPARRARGRAADGVCRSPSSWCSPLAARSWRRSPAAATSLSLGVARDDLRHRRGRARSPGRLRRADLVRPCRLHRPRRLCGRHSRRRTASPTRSIALPAALAVSALFALADRHRLPAHQGRLLHHDHARLRADGVLHRELARALWRRRRPHHRGAQHARRLRAARERPRVLLRRASPACSAPICFCRALVASRFGRVLRGARENPVRMATIGFDVYRFQLAAYVIAGALGGPLRLPARQCDRVREPRLHVLAALGRADRHGDARRPRHRSTARSSAPPPFCCSRSGSPASPSTGR